MDYRLSLSGEDVNDYLVNKFSGVGMIRGEYILRYNDESITLKSCQEILQTYVEKIAKAFYPKPVWYRCIELWSDEANTLIGNDLELDEQNPIVGLRGLRRAFATENTFELELMVIKEVAEKHKNLHIIFPFVGDVHEFKKGVSFLNKVKWPNQFGTMIEIPSAVLESENFVKEGAANLMIGMNDLTSLMLGAARVSGYDNKLHNSLKLAIDYVSRNVQKAEWGIAGNLSREFIEFAQLKNVPYLSLHYFDLDNTIGVPLQYLPQKNMVRMTKDKTRSRIHSYNIDRILKQVRNKELTK